MKTTIKLVLALSLFGSIVLADDGNQGNGGSPLITETKAPSVMTAVVAVVERYFGLGC